MGKVRYQKAKEFLERVKLKSGESVPFTVFKKEMMMELGADDTRTLRPYLKLMLETDLIKQDMGGTYVIIS